jgi:hypothetical protein
MKNNIGSTSDGVCGAERLIAVLAVHFTRSVNVTCQLLYVSSMQPAAGYRPAQSSNFKVPQLCKGCQSVTFLAWNEVRNLILKLLQKVTGHPVYQVREHLRP